LWLVRQYKSHEAALARILREPSADTCAACGRRQELARRNRDEDLAEIAALPQSVLTYAEYCRRDGYAADTVGERLEQTDSPADDEVVSTLVSLAREGRESDFRWLAASRGVPPAELDVMWGQTRARLRKAKPVRRPLEGLDGGRA